MNNCIERNYVKYLLNELDESEKNVKEIEFLSNNNAELKDIIEQRDKTIKEQNKTIQKLKTELKKPVKISNPQTFDIFTEIKNGNIIKPILPTINKQYKQYSSFPFLFELENKKAIFEKGLLLGMFETVKGNNYWYNTKKCSNYTGLEILQLLGADEETKDCEIKIGKSRIKKVKNNFKTSDLLKLNPIVNIETSKFVSSGNNLFVYTKNDGSKYVVLADGSEEVY